MNSLGPMRILRTHGRATRAVVSSYVGLAQIVMPVALSTLGSHRLQRYKVY